ncbi:MAG: hypothetical protein IMZ44_18580 [Planctomycetes bacterium]|nr:hypothetical protein [Planctomycetota bacterium]
MRKPIARVMVSCACLGWLVATAAAQTAAAQGPVPAAARLRLVKLLPDAAAIGAKTAGDPVFYGENLFEYINGGAEAYHQYEFAALAHQKYRIGDLELTVDIYDMRDALNAFGIYASERAPGYNYIPIGAEGYLNEPVLNFQQGAYYVKLAAFSRAGRSAAQLERAARSVSAKIGTGKTLPATFALFPSANRAPRSERFVRRSPLGHDYLAPMFQADYASGGRKVTLALSDAGNAREAVARAKTLEEHFRKAGKVGTAAPAAPGAFRGVSRYDGEMIWAARGRFVALLIGTAPGGDDLFVRLLAALPPR